MKNTLFRIHLVSHDMLTKMLMCQKMLKRTLSPCLIYWAMNSWRNYNRLRESSRLLRVCTLGRVMSVCTSCNSHLRWLNRKSQNNGETVLTVSKLTSFNTP